MGKIAGTEKQGGWIEGLLDPRAYPHPVGPVELLETHISWILLTGKFAYKVKKPVDLGFVDFSTLSRRRYFCEEELRLNRRTAPDLYLEVLPIAAGPRGLRMGAEPAVEYAVRMRQFPAQQRLDLLLRDGRVDTEAMFEAGVEVAAFHEALPAWQFPDGVHPGERAPRPALNNLVHLAGASLGADQRLALRKVGAWTRAQALKLRPVCIRRYEAGRVRECHGDLHLANLYRSARRIVPFDCLEFDRDLRTIDVASDIAFLVMDLIFNQRTDLAYAFLNSWLQETGDYQALEVLRFYLVYRAMVRVKVASVRLQQTNGQDARARADLGRYLDLAVGLTRGHAPPRLVIMHGLSGSGKTWVSQRLMCALPAVRVRSDVERKRLHGLPARQSAAAAPGAGLYAPEATDLTYRALQDACASGLAAGFHMIADATFADRARRARFTDLARSVGAQPVILQCVAEPALLRRRLRRRSAAGTDASDADLQVLASQLRTFEAPAAGERSLVVRCDPEQAKHWAALRARVLALGQRAGPGNTPGGSR
jgi:aminoglycoside phosphotransferase family enzyme/predicted kinase